MVSPTHITLKVRIRRSRGWQAFQVTLPASSYILDVLEEIERQDPSLLFRHACHHASCGSCGLRVNGRERLACSTPIVEVARPGRTLRLEPLRNFPITGDLLVDFGSFMAGLDRANMPLIRQAELASINALASMRYENCIECGLCVSACPIAGSDGQYIGPAALAAAWRNLEEPRQTNLADIATLADGEQGIWRCHAAFECSEVCPSNVDPAGAIMSLRRFLLSRG
jgi:succinate dehydrogenase / fumarate reductase iron-sulfur subunit